MRLEKGYDIGPIYEACEARGTRPTIPLRQTQSEDDAQEAGSADEDE